MPNHPSVIARPTESGWEGRYVHNDGHPTIRIPLLRALYAGPFAGDLDAMTKFLVDAHPAGWSQLGLDPTVDTGYVNWHQRSGTSISDAVNDRGFRCYCHGDRNEGPYLHDENNTDSSLSDWVYVLRSDGVEVIDLDDGDSKTFPWQGDALAYGPAVTRLPPPPGRTPPEGTDPGRRPSPCFP